MAKGRVSGGTGLNLTARLKTADALKEADKFIKKLNEVNKAAGISPVNSGMSKAFDVKPLTEYQAGLLKIKQEAADSAKARQAQADAEKKAKQEQTAADKSASLVMQKALAEERLARQAVMLTTAKNRLEMQEATKLAREQAVAVKKLNDEYLKSKPVKNRDFSIEAQNQNASSKVNSLYTSTVTARVVADAKLTTELAKQAVAQNNLTSINTLATNTTTASTTAINANVQSKKQLAQQLILEKATQQAAQSALKAYTLEQAAAKGSTEQRKLALDRLRLAYSQLNEQERNSPAGTRLATIIKGVTDQVKNLELATKGSVSGLKAQEGMFTSLKSQLLGVAAGYASLAAAAAAAKTVVHNNAEVSDSMADVQRTAKLTVEQTDDLVDSLKKLDRRTNLTSLLDIGYIGGQLGVGKNDIQGYIEKIDELGVVLKKEFPGGAEAVAVSLGKLNSIYRITASEGITLEQSLSKIGSALLGIAHDGPVNVQYLQDFALRTAGAAQVAKLSLPTMLAYGAVLSEAGVTAQVASSSVNRLVSSLSGKREKYLAIAQLADSSLTIEKFTKLINTDTKAALDLFFKGLKSGNPTQTDFNDRMGTLNFKVGAATNSITALALGQDKLARKVSIGNEEYEKATLSAENYAIKNNTLAASMDKVSNAISNITTDPNSGLGKSIKFILDGVTDAIHALDNLIGRMGRYKSSYDDFFDRIQMAIINDPEASARVNERKQIKAQQAYKSLIEANRDQVVAQGTIKAKDIIDKNASEASLKSALKIEEGLLKSYFKQRDAAVAYYTNPENKDQALLSVAEKKAKDLQTTLLRQKTSVDLLRNAYKGKYGAVQKQEGQDEETPLGRTIDVIKADIKRVMDLKNPLNTASKQYKDYLRQLGVLKKELKLANGGIDNSGRNEENSIEAIRKSRNSLQKEIQGLISDSTKKQLSADDAEVKSVTEKYDKMREKAIEFNNSAKAKKFGLSTDIGSLGKAEKAEVQVVINKQSNERLKAQLADEAKDFEAFEQYKTQYGQKEAEKRFNNQFSTAEAYGQKLENLQTKLLSEITDPADATESQKQELDIITDAIKENAEKRKAINDSTYASAYQAAKTLSQNLLEIEKDYQKNVAALGEGATKEQLDKLAQEKLRLVSKASVDELTGSDNWTKLFSNLGELATRDIETLLREIKSKFSDLKVKFGPADLTSITESLEKARNELIQRNPFAAVGAAIQDVFTESVKGVKKSDEEIAADWKNLGEATKGAFKFVDDAIQSTDFLKDAIGDVGATAISSLATMASVAVAVTAAIKSTEKASVVLAIISAALAVAQAIAGFFKSIFNAHDKRLEKSIKAHKEQVDSLSTAYNRLENDVNRSVGKAVEQAHLRQIDNLKQQQVELEKIRNDEQSKKKPDQGKINDVNDQIASIGDKIKDKQDEIIQGLVGTTAKSISDGIIAGFKSGKRTMLDFGDDFRGMMEDSLLKALQTEYLDDAIAGFYKRYAEAAKGGLTDEKVNALKREYESIIQKGLDEMKNIDKITGGPKKDSDNSALKPNTLTAALNQPTGERLEGLWRGNFDLTKQLVVSSQTTGLTIGQMYETATANLNVAIKIEANTFRTANNTDSLAGKLDQIITNTKPSKSARD